MGASGAAPPAPREIPSGLSTRALIGKVGMAKLEKVARMSGKATSNGLDALARHGFDLRAKLSVPISRVPGRAPPSEKPKSDE